MVWIFWAHVSKASFGLYQIPLNRWQHNSFLKAKNFLRISCVSLLWFLERLQELRQKSKHNKEINFLCCVEFDLEPIKLKLDQNAMNNELAKVLVQL